MQEKYISNMRGFTTSFVVSKPQLLIRIEANQTDSGTTVLLKYHTFVNSEGSKDIIIGIYP